MCLPLFFSVVFLSAQPAAKFFPAKDLTSVGVYYYPEHWDSTQWVRDFQNMAKLGFERQVVLRCRHCEAACKVVAASDCLLTMPRRQVRVSSGLAVMAMPLALPDLELHAYWHRQRETEPALMWLREQLFQALQAS